MLQHVNLREYAGFDEQPPEVARRRTLLEEIKGRVVHIDCASGHAFQCRCDVRTSKPADH